MLSIRLQRIGKKHQPSYRLVVAPGRSKLIAPPTEDLGSYNPFTKKSNFKAERIKYWLGVGAQPSLSVHNLLVKNGLVTAPKKRVPMPKAAPKSEKAKEEAPAEEVVSEEPVAEEASAPEAAATE